MLRNMFGGTKCRTIDKVDIFGDSSGVVLYRLDGNANDTGGNYHGTETNITYGGGVYERGAIITATNSRVASAVPVRAISMWINRYTSSTNINARLFYTTSNHGAYLDANTNNILEQTGGTITKIKVNNVLTNIITRDSLIHVYIELNLTTSGTTYIGNHSTDTFQIGGIVDQVRVFNRALTDIEVATLYAECAPTSIVDNANPFEDNSLKAMYQFNGNANDLTGVYNGTATNVTYAAGKFGQCAVGDGSLSKIKADFPYTNSMAISCWGYITTLGQAQFIFGEADTLGTNASIRIALGLTATNNYQIYLGNGTLGLNSNTIVSGLLANTWYHFTLVINNLNVMLYRDGALVANLTSTTPIGTHTAGNFAFLDLGNYATAGVFSWNGSIDQLRIFNKALTPMEVASLYTETTPMEEPLATLVDPFKDGSGKALYRLEGNALDESGNYNGTPTSVTYGNGISGRSPTFNNTSAYISNTFTGVGFDDFTISVWVNPTSVALGTWQQIIGGVNITNYYSYFIDQDTLGRISISDSHGGTAASTANNALPIANVWYHLCFTKVGTARKLYINGVLSINDSLGTVTVAKPTGLMIGKYFNSTTQSWNGSIDQLRIFNRSVTQAEVTQLYTNLS